MVYEFLAKGLLLYTFQHIRSRFVCLFVCNSRIPSPTSFPNLFHHFSIAHSISFSLTCWTLFGPINVVLISFSFFLAGFIHIFQYIIRTLLKQGPISLGKSRQLFLLALQISVYTVFFYFFEIIAQLHNGLFSNSQY